MVPCTTAWRIVELGQFNPLVVVMTPEYPQISIWHKQVYSMRHWQMVLNSVNCTNEKIQVTNKSNSTSGFKANAFIPLGTYVCVMHNFSKIRQSAAALWRFK